MKQPRLGACRPGRLVGHNWASRSLYMFLPQRSSARRFRHALFRTGLRIFPDWNISFHIGGWYLHCHDPTDCVGGGGRRTGFLEVDKMAREYFFLLILSLGAYGFFISIDLMILFFFLEVAVIPKYLLIAVWGSGKRIQPINWP